MNFSSRKQSFIERNYSHFYLINVFSAVIRQSIKFYFFAKKIVYSLTHPKKNVENSNLVYLFSAFAPNLKLVHYNITNVKHFLRNEFGTFFLFILKRFLNSDCAFLYLLTEICFEFIQNRHKISIQFVALNTFSMCKAWICFYLIICSNVFLSLSFYFSFNIRFQVGR